MGGDVVHQAAQRAAAACGGYATLTTKGGRVERVGRHVEDRALESVPARASETSSREPRSRKLRRNEAHTTREDARRAGDSHRAKGEHLKWSLA